MDYQVSGAYWEGSHIEVVFNQSEEGISTFFKAGENPVGSTFLGYSRERIKVDRPEDYRLNLEDFNGAEVHPAYDMFPFKIKNPLQEGHFGRSQRPPLDYEDCKKTHRRVDDALRKGFGDLNKVAALCGVGCDPNTGRHPYHPEQCPQCEATFCYACCGGANVDQGGKHDPDYMFCPVCGHDVKTF